MWQTKFAGTLKNCSWLPKYYMPTLRFSVGDVAYDYSRREVTVVAVRWGSYLVRLGNQELNLPESSLFCTPPKTAWEVEKANLVSRLANLT